MTMAHKVLAAHSGQRALEPGQVVVTEVDRIVVSDAIFQRTVSALPSDILRVDHPDRVAVVLDHGAPAPTPRIAEAHARAREHARRLGLEYFADVGRNGIEHQVVLESGWALPGQLLACNDSHTTSAGALNCAARGLGVADVIQALCTGRTWYQVAPTVRFLLTGALGEAAFAKDLFLHLAAQFGSQEGHDVEFAGPGLAGLSLDDRGTLCTMCTELNAEFAMMPADDLVHDHLRDLTTTEYQPVTSDPGAAYAAEHSVELADVRPLVALPGGIIGNVRPAAELADQRVAIDQAFVGSCANGKLSDLAIAARIVRGRRVADGVRLIVTPASQQTYLEAVRAGYVATLLEAGAVVTNSTCGACAGGHLGVLGSGERCISSSTRNVPGRMGSPEAEIYLGSSATVAASALAGHIVDPTPYLAASGP
jgi:3-isopropylmalate/(R)-2-methylmalate dehydratase large subunit